MKTWKRLTWGSAKLWLGAVAVAVAALAVTRDPTPTNAVNPEILPSLSSSTPAYAASTLLVKGGQLTSGNSACVGDTDPTTLCLRIWAKGVVSPGTSGFGIQYVHPTDRLQVTSVNASPTWLGSTGRSVACPTGNYQLGQGSFGCATVNQPPPWGVTGDGLLATIAVSSMDITGLATFTLASGTMLADMIVEDPGPIPATVRSINVIVAPCADFNNSGTVTVSDIIYVVQRYHTSDPLADLDGSGSVTVTDIIISVQEFAMQCTR